MVCENCGKEHDGSYGSGRFCCKECAKSFSTKNIIKGQLKEAKCIDCGKIIYIDKRASNKKCRCEECKKINYLIKRCPIKKENINKINYKNNCNIFNNIDCNNCYFKQHNICKSKGGILYKFKTLQKYCNLNISSDYNILLEDYLNIKYTIQKMIDNGLSMFEIYTKLFGSSKRGSTILNILELNNRSISESVANAYIQGRMNYKDTYHITWNNKEVYLRSSYELDYAKELDEQQIDYEVESLKIKYWDSKLLKYRQAIPDFYIPSINTIIEIKSTWTLDEQNMKDKMKAYLNLGYNFKCICNHKEIFL